MTNFMVIMSMLRVFLSARCGLKCAEELMNSSERLLSWHLEKREAKLEYWASSWNRCIQNEGCHPQKRILAIAKISNKDFKR